MIAISADFKGQPVGIALATAHTKVHTSHIHLLFVDERYRSEGLEKELLIHLTAELQKLGVTLSTYTYTTQDPYTQLIEKTFHDQHWNGPRPLLIECLFKRKDFNPDWLHKVIELKEGFQEFPWKNLTQAENKKLIYRAEQMSIPSYVAPLERETDKIELGNSLGLRYKEEIIGWMITHRIIPDTIRYSALYLDDAFSHTRYWLKLLIDAIRIHIRSLDAPYGLLEMNLDQIPKRWLRFVEKRLFPHAYKITYRNQFWKKI